jgi:hypothetical protein
MSSSEWETFAGTSSSASIWEHFERRKDGSESRCRKCSKIFKGAATSSLKYHAENIHLLQLEKTATNSSATSAKQKQQSITSLLQKPDLQKPNFVLARMVAEDRLPFKTIAGSVEIKAGFKARGLKIPETANGIKGAVFTFANKIEEELKEDLACRILKGERFSMSLDEYTSPMNRRYMCLNLHDGKKAISLGMIRVKGSMPAETGLELVDLRLQKYGLTRKRHIVGATTDGASVMKKLGRLMEIEHQQCHAHGVHLAVADLIYKLPQQPEAPEPIMDEIDSDDGEESDDEFDDAYTEENVDVTLQIGDQIEPLIRKVRKIVQLFRRSPVKNDKLQKYVIDSYQVNGPLHLIIDVKTRWNSLLAMLRRFLRIRTEVEKTLIDLSMHELLVSE